MQPKVVNRPAFQAIGLSYVGKNEHDEIGQMWGRFNLRAREIQSVNQKEAFGLCFSTVAGPARPGEFEYVACLQVADDSAVPTGMVFRQVPAYKYAVFTHHGKLDKLGDLLDAAVRAGANNINSIQFDVADKTKALSDARIAAVKTANTQAAELATAAGVSLGSIQSIQYSDATPSPIFQGKSMGGGGSPAADVAVPINPGEMDITVSVTIAYEIK